MRYLLSLLMIIFVSILWGQDITLDINGLLKNDDNGTKLGGATITVFKNGSSIASTQTASNGKFRIKATGPANGLYKIVFSKPGMVTKLMTFNAEGIEVEDLPSGNIVGFPSFEGALFAERPEVDFSFLQQEKNAAVKWSWNGVQALPDNKEANRVRKEIEKLLIEADKEAAEAEAKYNNAILAGDMHMSSGAYEKAVKKFEEALTYKPGEDYPTDKLKELEALIKAQKDAELANEQADKEYDDLINQADDLRDKESFEPAIAKYEEALKLKSEQYPKDQISAIRKKISELAAEADNQAKYDAVMAEAASKFSADDLLGAKSKYIEAKSIKPSESLPKEKIKEIEDLLKARGDEKEKQEKYDAAIKEADALFSSQKYEAAKKKYNEALNLDEQDYPKSQIKICDQKIEELRGEKDLMAQIKDLMKFGNEALLDEDYDSAIANYEDVLELDESHSEAKNKLKMAQDALAKINTEYNSHIAKGDELVSKQKYIEAIQEYNSALALKPKEQEPVDKAKEAQRLSEAANSEFDQQYEKLLATADSKAEGAEYERALELVNRAKNIKKSDPRQDEILSKIKRYRARDAKYDQLMSQGESLANSKKYKEARDKFVDAGNTKPDEALPPKRVSAMDGLISESASEAERDALYQGYMKDGQSNLNKREYEKALSDYKNALNVKEGDVAAQNKINEIQQILDDIANAETSEKERKEKFDRLIKEADDFFESEDYLSAKTKYEDALAQIATSKYARVQRDESIRREKERSLAEEERIYRELIDVADQSFDAEDYEKSKGYYTTANTTRPSDPYPKLRLQEIESILNPTIVQSEGLEDLGTPFSGSILDGDHALKADDEKRKRMPGYQVLDISDGIKDEERLMTKDKTEAHYDNTNEIYEITDKIIATTKSAEKDLAERANILDGSMVALSEEEKRSAQYEYSENIDASGIVELINEDAAIEYGEKESVYFDNTNILNNYTIEQEEELKNKSLLEQEANIESDQTLEGIMQDVNSGVIEDYEDRERAGRVVGTIQKKYRDEDMVAQKKEYGTIQETNVEVKQIQLNVDHKFVEDAKISNDNNEELKKVDLQFTSDSRDIYNQENEKYLANHEQIKANTDENSEINEVAEESMDKKREYVEKMDERAKFRASEFQSADTKGQYEARETIDDINQGVNDKTGDEYDRIAENGEVLEDIDLSLSAADRNKRGSEKAEQLEAKEMIDGITNEPPEKGVVVNSLGKEYPPGVSQEIFTNQDQNGLMKEVITRRIVVVDGHADVYIRTQTMYGITYSKNGKASLEHVWQSETQHPSLERHF